MTYHNAIKYIKNAPNVTPAESSARERIERLCRALGDPQRKIKYVRLAGSNGKSVCARMMTSILNKANILSGSLTMPLLSELRENIRIGGEPLSIEETVELTERVVSAVALINAEYKAQDPNCKRVFTPTTHEIMLSIALLAFVSHGCRLAFIESEHNAEDPSRFLPLPLSAIICGAIPSEDKNEISKMRTYIQRGINEITSVPQDKDAYAIIASTCQSANCRLTMSMPHIAVVSSLNLGGTKFTYKDNDYSLKICGRFQVTNAILAIESAEMLIRNGFKISKQNIIDGLASTVLPAKFEVLSASPTIIVDSTHAPIAIETVSDSMKELMPITGNKVRLCLTSLDLCEQYVSALVSRGYEIEGVMALSPTDEDTPIPEGIALYKTPKLLAKAALKNLSSDSLLLVSGKVDKSRKIRYEMLGILGF